MFILMFILELFDCRPKKVTEQVTCKGATVYREGSTVVTFLMETKPAETNT